MHVAERQLPELYARVKAAAGKLGLDEIPDIYLVQSNGLLNAFATRMLSRNFVIVCSALADACEDPRQLDFIIGHELGHLAAGHLRWNLALAPFHLVPWLGAACSRAREYTCDALFAHPAEAAEEEFLGIERVEIRENDAPLSVAPAAGPSAWRSRRQRARTAGFI